MPRSGTTLLQHYLQDIRNLKFAGEFLTINVKPSLLSAEQVADTGVFMDDYITKEVNIQLSQSVESTFRKEEFSRRIQYIQEFSKKHGPVVVKVFSSTFRFNPLLLDEITDLFDIVILSRKNSWLASLSSFICLETKTWHSWDPDEINKSKKIINESRFSVNEESFYYQVMQYNFLYTLQMNIKQFNSDAVSLYFEDYEADPVNKLNEIFDTTMKSPMLGLSKLIDDHESCIVNIESLRKIYNRYALRLL